MEHKLTLLIVDDDQNTCENFRRYINTLSNVTVIGITNNATEAIAYIKTHTPIAVILDLELHTGCGCGLDVLQETRNMSLHHKPFFLITTNNSSKRIHACARDFGADFILNKQQENYSEKYVIHFLTNLSLIPNRQHFISKYQHIEDTFAQKNQHLTQQNQHLTQCITSELLQVGISPKCMGFSYLVEAITFVYYGNTYHLCNHIAKKYQKSDASVERAMQNAIHRAWHIHDIQTLSLSYTARITSDKGVPTLTEFIHYYAAKLQKDLI